MIFTQHPTTNAIFLKYEENLSSSQNADAQSSKLRDRLSEYMRVGKCHSSDFSVHF